MSGADAKSISAAVNHYINYQVGQLAQINRYQPTTKESVRVDLSSNSNDTFLWVALVCQNLKKTHRHHVTAKLKEFPPGLDSLYKRMMHEVDESEDRDLLKKTLAVISVFRRPTTLEELRALAEIPDEWAGDLQSSAEWIELCGSFLFLRERTIYLLHQSAQDFLLKTLPDVTLPRKLLDLHYSIFLRSLETMSWTLRRDMYHLEAPGYSIDQVQQPSVDPLVAVRYSCVHWIEHLVEWFRNDTAEERVISDIAELLATFFKQKFLHWLEALSLLGSISEGVRYVIELERTTRVDCYMATLLPRENMLSFF